MQNRSFTVLQATLRVLAISLVATFVLGAAAIAFAGSDTTDRTTGPNGDPAESLPIDITSAAIAQHADRLTLSVDTAGAIDPDQLRASSGAGICWSIAVGSELAKKYCLARTPGDWALTDSRGRTIASTTDFGHSNLAVSAAISDLKLQAGPAKWSVTATPANCAVAGSTAATSKPETCADRAPDRGKPDFGARIWQLRAVGCTAKPAMQYNSGPPNKQISLTFDDGPSGYTPAFLKQLKKLKIHATFFMIGRQVPGKGALLRQMLDDGHELGNHSWNHANLGAGGAAAAQQLKSTQAAIKRASGYTPCVFRPPYGATSANLVGQAKAQGLATIIWSVDPTDWSTPGTSTIVNRVMAQTGKGGIILDHDGGGNRSQTLAAFPQFVQKLQAKGYKFVTVAEQLGFETKYKLAR